MNEFDKLLDISFGTQGQFLSNKPTPEQRIRDLERVLDGYRKEFERIQARPGALRVVIATSGSRITVATPMAPLEIDTPRDLAKPITPGTTVRVDAQSGAFIEVSPVKLGGPVHTVSRVGRGWVEIEVHGDHARVPCAIPVKPGERVSLDPTSSVVTDNLGGASTFKAPAADVFEWHDIVGLADAKRELRAAIEDPHRHPELHAQFGKRPVRGILLSGPPGNGKTLLARAAATALRNVHGGTGASGFIYVKGPEILGHYVGQSEKAIRGLFQRAREHFLEHGYPAVMFIDEADAVLSKRGTGRSSDMERTIVPQFLAELDGLDASSCLVLLATNRPNILDPAVVRPGRIDRVIHVARPSSEDVEIIIQRGFTGKPMGSFHDGQTSPRLLALTAVSWLFDERRIIRTVQTIAGQIDVPLERIVSAAIAASVVERSLARALQRAVGGEVAGVTHEDVVSAVESIAEEHRHIDLGDDVHEWVIAQAKSRANGEKPRGDA